MLMLTCPWCGERPEGEFTNLGEAGPPRPEDPSAMTDAEWSASISARENIRGRHNERWWHMRGCGTIFIVVRDTVTHDLFEAIDGPSQ
jgi:sarcosine oxidase, subunit delta